MSRLPCSRWLKGLGITLLVIGVVLVHSIGPFLILAGLVAWRSVSPLPRDAIRETGTGGARSRLALRPIARHRIGRGARRSAQHVSAALF